MKIKLDENNFDISIKSGLKLVEFHALWCGYCKKQEPILEEMDKIWIGQVDIDSSPNLVERYNIKGFPTFLIFKNGEEVERFSGLTSKYDIMNNLMRYIDSDKQVLLNEEAEEDF